jgi:hypothetical protein
MSVSSSRCFSRHCEEAHADEAIQEQCARYQQQSRRHPLGRFGAALLAMTAG